MLHAEHKGDQILVYRSCQGRKLDARVLLLEVWSKQIQGLEAADRQIQRGNKVQIF